MKLLLIQQHMKNRQRDVAYRLKNEVNLIQEYTLLKDKKRR